MAEGAEPLKPLNGIPSAVILISNSVVAGFRGEKMARKIWIGTETCGWYVLVDGESE